MKRKKSKEEELTMDERNVKEFLESTWEELHKIPEPGDKTPQNLRLAGGAAPGIWL